MKETILLTKHMRENPEDSHLIESYEKSNGYNTAKKTLLGSSPEKVLEEINMDIGSQSKMFRLLQGDVGSGKTIVALISAINVISSGFQVCFMAPTEILAKQHFNLANKLFDKNDQIPFVGLELNEKTKKISFKKR